MLIKVNVSPVQFDPAKLLLSGQIIFVILFVQGNQRRCGEEIDFK